MLKLNYNIINRKKYIWKEKRTEIIKKTICLFNWALTELAKTSLSGRMAKGADGRWQTANTPHLK